MRQVKVESVNTNFQICLYTYEPCLPKGSDCPAEGGGVGLSGGRGGKGVPWILETGPGPPTVYVQIMYRLFIHCTINGLQTYKYSSTDICTHIFTEREL